MATYLFPRFLIDANDYRAAAHLWRSRWNELLHDAPERATWTTPWVTTTFADGTSVDDGNPIFSAVCNKRRIGVRVIQEGPGGDPTEFSFWTAKFAKGSGEEISELVICCVLTDYTLLKALDLIRQWVRSGEVRLEREPQSRVFTPRWSDSHGATSELMYT